MNTVFRFRDKPELMARIHEFAASFKDSVTRINECHTDQALVHENHDTVEMEINDNKYLNEQAQFEEYEAKAVASLT